VSKKATKGAVAADARSVFRVGPGFDLAAVDPDAVRAGPGKKADAPAAIAPFVPVVDDLHDRLWASAKAGGTQAVLVVLQGMDTSGKGGAAKAVDTLLDPAGVTVVGFGKPTAAEVRRGFLWRHERALPSAGRITVFDRSHYEAVLVERVAGIVPESVWSSRYDEINQWEAGLAERGITMLKVMLHISRDEQRQRFLDRLADPSKHWKYNPADIDVRAQWDDYMAAFQDALVRTSTEVAPWYVVPANRKWHRDWAISALLTETMQSMGLEYPPTTFDVAAEIARVERS
jgi:PPK2 family polyphosphate:nucleotide phosphotransferase